MADFPVILALDTTIEFASVAVRSAHATSSEVRLHSRDGFSGILFGAIEEALAQAGTTLEEIDCFAAANGPGSFTGVRMGLTAIKGLAEALRKPAAAISNLRALSLCGTAPLRAVVLDARRGAVYGAVYDAEARIVVPEVVTPWAAWLATLPPDAELIGFEDGPCRTGGVEFTVASPYLAPLIARCAELDGPEGWSDPVGLEANYVRRSDAEMSWTD